ncbi:FMN-binding protein [bacterium]|nr:FMN-binding protein [candidate division CSSED10-310 bacterium]
MKVTVTSGIVGMVLLVLLAQPATALKFNAMKSVVEEFVGKDVKLLQKHLKVTEEVRTAFMKDLNWTPEDDDVLVYYARDAEDRPIAFVLFLTFSLQQFANSHHLLGIGLAPDGTILGVRPVELTDPYSFEINRRSFLSQFEGGPPERLLDPRADIKVVTGASESSHGAALLVNRAKLIYTLLISPAFF